MDLHYKQEATVGALVLVALILFIGGTMWLGGKQFSTRTPVAVQFADDGTLKRGSPVRGSGVQLSSAIVPPGGTVPVLFGVICRPGPGR